MDGISDRILNGEIVGNEDNCIMDDNALNSNDGNPDGRLEPGWMIEGVFDGSIDGMSEGRGDGTSDDNVGTLSPATEQPQRS